MSSGFAALPLSPALLSVTSELGYLQPTAIQSACIPAILSGKDVIGQSQTGSGKTAAFGLPILETIQLGRPHVQALILCPTRELATQVAQELRKLGRRHPGLFVRTICGGEPMREQSLALKRGVHIVVGTPGRVVDHLERGHLALQGVRTVVLDEADRMLEMGFVPALDQIIAAAPQDRQTICFSATFPESIAQLSLRVLRDPERITVADPIAAPLVRQVSLSANSEEKIDALRWVLSSQSYESAIVFCNMKATAQQVAQRLHLDGVSVDSLHGDLEQYDRDKVMALFKNQSFRVLVATDVAARGIDVSELDLVVNVELPSQRDIYVHRIGRTGRAGSEGLAVSLVSDSESRRLLEIVGEEKLETMQWSSQVDRASLTRPPLMQTLRIAGGRKDKMRPGDILGALTGEAGGLDGADIGKIQVQDRFCYVAVRLQKSGAALRSLSNGKIKGRRFKVTLLD